MTITAYSPDEGRLVSLKVTSAADTTTWFSLNGAPGQIAAITDCAGGLLIRTADYCYPVWLAGLSRAQIGFSRAKAQDLLRHISY